MADLEVKACGSSIKIKDGITFDKAEAAAQKEAVLKQIDILANMISLLEFKGYILQFIKEYSPVYEAKLMELTKTKTYDAAEKKATQAKRDKADIAASNAALEAMFPGKSIGEAINIIFGKVRSLAAYAKGAWAGKGVKSALTTILGMVPGEQKKLAKKLDKTTLDLIGICDPKWLNPPSGNLDPMNLDASKLGQVKKALEELLKLRQRFVPCDFNTRAKEILRAQADQDYKSATAEPDNWRYNLYRWLDRNPAAPRPMIQLDMGVIGTPGIDTKIIGEPGPVKLNISPKLALDWDRLRTGNYSWRVTPYYSLNYNKGLGGDTTPGTTDHDGGVLVSGEHLGKSYIPNFNLRLNGRSYQSDISRFPYFNESTFNLRGSIDQQIAAWNSGSLRVDAGADLSIGTRNDLAWMRAAMYFGPRINLGPVSLFAGYRQVEQRYDASISSSLLGMDQTDTQAGDIKHQGNRGQGFYAGAGVKLGRGGILNLAAYYDRMAKFHDEAGLSFSHRIAIPSWRSNLVWGLDYSEQNLNNGVSRDVIGRIGIEDRPIYDYFATIGANLFGGYKSLSFDEQNSVFANQSGGVVGLNLTFRFGGSQPVLRTKANLDAVAPTMADHDSELRQARSMSSGNIPAFSDPKVRMLLNSTSVDAQRLVAFLIQFKNGELNADYTLNQKKLPGDIKLGAKEADKKAAAVNETKSFVELGDIAPIEFYIGQSNPVGRNEESQLKSEYYPNILRATPDKLYVLKVAVARKSLGIALKKSNEGTRIAKTLIDVLKIAYDKLPEREKFETNELEAELAARAIGKATIAFAKYVLTLNLTKAKGRDLTQQEKKLVADALVVNQEMLNAIMGYVYNIPGVKDNRTNDPDQCLTGPDQLTAALKEAGRRPAAPASRPTSRPAPQIAPTTPAADKDSAKNE